MDEITTVMGVLGGFFAVILALSVSVETLLEPLTSLRSFQKQVSPDEILSDIKGWLPPIADGGAKAAAIANLSHMYGVNLVDLTRRLNVIKVLADETAKGLGVQKQVDDYEKKIAVYMAALRQRYAITESKRISLLRMMAAAIGIAIAMLLRINSLDILAALLPAEVRLLLTGQAGAVGGMVITGLAASAGSSFWHDQLGRARAIKDAARNSD